jgi:choline dehydrogenase-like flavoprotein
MDKEYDVIVVGSGPGGAAVARESAKNRKKVLLIERGGRINRVGNSVAMALMAKRFGLTLSKEGNWVVSVNNYGGASNVAAGCAVAPPQAVFSPLGIDLTKAAAAARIDLWVQQLPDELVGSANLRILEAANDLGYHWTKLEKFIDPQKCVPECADCMLGCKRGAKWTSRIYGDEAVSLGADLALHTRVTRVITENGKATGVEAVRWGMPVRYYGKSVVISAAVGSPVILNNSGINDAGKGFACDWLQFVGGIVPGMNTLSANPMSVGTLEHYESDGIVILPVFPGWSAFLMQLVLAGPTKLPRLMNLPRYTGIMVKIRDDITGQVISDSSFSKPLTDRDIKRLKKGTSIIRKILGKLGAPDHSMIELPPIGAHPSATCRIGAVVDSNLETSITNLFVCDSSVFPQSLGLPVVWTVASLGKRLAEHLDGRLR